MHRLGPKTIRDEIDRRYRVHARITRGWNVRILGCGRSVLEHGLATRDPAQAMLVLCPNDDNDGEQARRSDKRGQGAGYERYKAFSKVADDKRWERERDGRDGPKGLGNTKWEDAGLGCHHSASRYARL